MTITTTTDPNAINVTEESAVILEDDLDWLKELVGNIRWCTNCRIIREAEQEFHEEMTNRYGRKVAGKLLSMLWKMSV